MADVIRVKPKKNYEWNEDQANVYMQIALPGVTTLAQVDIYLSDLILRVTNSEKKSTQFIDLCHEVDYRSSENKFVFTNGALHATLKKSEPAKMWESLVVEGISLAELKNRRRASEARYEQHVKSIEENKEKLKHEYDRKATQQLMRFEEDERKKLDAKKQAEKDAAIQELFSNVNEKTGIIQRGQVNGGNSRVQHQESKWRQKERIALEQIEREEAEEKKQLAQNRTKNEGKLIEELKKKYQSKTNNTMFTQQDINRLDGMRMDETEITLEEIPVRKANNLTVKFTEKMYPGLAARDTFYKDPPMPKNKNSKGQGQGENKNPLWLKDDGDQFLKNKNYLSAIEAYNEAIKIDSNMRAAYLNRSFCYMKLFKINEAISDCDHCIAQMQTEIVDGDSQKELSSSRLQLAKIKTRKAICLAWKGSLQSAKQLLAEVQNEELPQDIKQQVRQCIYAITKREDSLKWKVKGDEHVKVHDYKEAIQRYDSAIQIDENQYAISNKLLCFNRLQQYAKTVSLADVGINKVNAFINSPQPGVWKQDKQVNVLLLKFYYRKALALKELNQLSEAEEAIRKGLNVDGGDEDLQNFLKDIKTIQGKQKALELKEEASELIKKGKYSEALAIYTSSLKMLQSPESIPQYLSILQNQCVCHLKLGDYDSIISVCIRILKVINNLQSKIVQFGDKRPTNMTKDELDKISVRTLVRRANAYLKTNQIYNSKSDLQKALQISPNEPIVMKQLDKLKKQLEL